MNGEETGLLSQSGELDVFLYILLHSGFLFSSTYRALTLSAAYQDSVVDNCFSQCVQYASKYKYNAIPINQVFVLNIFSAS